MSRTLSPALQKLIASFRRALPEKFDEIRELHQACANDPQNMLEHYYTAVHRLAGSSGSYGFPEVSTSARVLDRYLSDVRAAEKTFETDQAASLLDDLQVVIHRAAQSE